MPKLPSTSLWFRDACLELLRDPSLMGDSANRKTAFLFRPIPLFDEQGSRLFALDSNFGVRGEDPTELELSVCSLRLVQALIPPTTKRCGEIIHGLAQGMLAGYPTHVQEDILDAAKATVAMRAHPTRGFFCAPRTFDEAVASVGAYVRGWIRGAINELPAQRNDPKPSEIAGTSTNSRPPR